jgi:hypothetical protein
VLKDLIQVIVQERSTYQVSGRDFHYIALLLSFQNC